MPECDYCGESFGDEDALLQHMGDAHEGDLGRIDQRRVAEHLGNAEGGAVSPTLVYGVVGLVVVAIVAGGVYAAVTLFSGPGERVHEHGTINMTVEGERLSFSEPQHTANGDFHFHGSGPQWHMHPSEPGRLTLSEAMADVGIELTEESVTVGNQTYRASDPGTTITIEVNGESVDPESYELHGSGPNPQEGDHVHIVVETEE